MTFLSPVTYSLSAVAMFGNLKVSATLLIPSGGHQRWPAFGGRPLCYPGLIDCSRFTVDRAHQR